MIYSFGSLFMLPLLAANNVSITMPFIVIALLLGGFIFLAVQHMATLKEKLDEFQEKVGRAGGMAYTIGFQLFDDLLYAIAGGSVRRIKKAAMEIFKKYCMSPDGVKQLAADVVVHCYAFIRNDPVHGNEVRRKVVASALGYDPNDRKRAADFTKASGKFEKISWTKTAKASALIGADDYVGGTNSIVSLVEEVLEEDGEKKLSLRVAKGTIQVCFDDPRFRDQIMPILRDFVQKDDDRIAAEENKALTRAREIIKEKAAATVDES